METVNYRKLERKDVNQIIELRKQQLQEEGAEATIELTEPLNDYYNRHLRVHFSYFRLCVIRRS